MKPRNIFILLLFTITATFSSVTKADSMYSVASLTLLCGSNDEHYRDSCKIYLRGVVETWMLKDLSGANPMHYQSKGNTPTFCEKINKVSADEWLRIVQTELKKMEPDFASVAVMEALARKLCK